MGLIADVLTSTRVEVQTARQVLDQMIADEEWAHRGGHDEDGPTSP
jgi:hypothetical protein